MEFNKYQTPIEELTCAIKDPVNDTMEIRTWDTTPDEVKEEFMDHLNSIRFIQHLVSKDRKLVGELPRDENGRAIWKLTEPPIIENTDYFRPTALHYQKYGTLTDLRPNPNPESEYYKWVKEEARRCREGFLRPSDGAWIPGDMYFYLNYSPIKLSKSVDGTSMAEQVVDHPLFWEGILWRFMGWYNARRHSRNFAEIAKRGASKSYCSASKLAKIAVLGESEISNRNLRGIVLAYLRTYLVGDGTLNKFEDMLNFIATNTEWPTKRLKSSINEMDWQMGYVDLDTGAKRGTGNEVLGIAVKDDPDKPRGKRASFIAVEEFGNFPSILDVYDTLLPSVKDGNLWFGQIVLIGTGGTAGADFSGALEMIYHPSGYFLEEFDNVWDKAAQSRARSIFFFPAYVNRTGCMSPDGISDVTAALFQICWERYTVKYNTSDANRVTKTKAENPITIQDAIMRRDGSFFPVAQLGERSLEIDADPNFYDRTYVGDLILDRKGEVTFKPTDDTPIRFFPHKTNKIEGAFEIYEMPEKGKEGKVFNSRYIAGCDPVDDDASETMSLVSSFVLDTWTDRIVAEWTGRLPFADDCYEKVRKLCIFYNAKLNYENNKKGLYTYFKKMNSLYLLVETLDILKDKMDIKSNLYGNKMYGVSATNFINNWGRSLIKEWLLMPVTIIEKDEHGEEQEVQIMNLQRLRGRALIEELKQWNPDGNYDRCVMAGTTIMTDSGFKLIEDIKEGDSVLGISGTYNTVEHTMSNDFSGNACTIRLSGDYRVLHCTDNHPILVRHQAHIRRKKWMEDKFKLSAPEYVRADSINKDSDFLLVPKRQGLQPCFLPDDLLYILGWYIADGNITSGHYVKFFLQEDQYEIGLDLVNILNKYWGRSSTPVHGHMDKNGRYISPYVLHVGASAKIKHSKAMWKGRQSRMWVVEIPSAEAQRFFRTYGGGPNRKDLADVIYNSTGLLPLLRGFFEGDGHYRCDVRTDGYERNSLECSTIYVNLATKIRQVIIDMGIWVAVRYVKERNERTRPQYSINITGDYVLPIIAGSKKFKQKNRTDRKHIREPFIQDEMGFWVKAKEYEKYTYDGQTYNIEVKNDHSYVADGITTHNCSALGMLMLYREDLLVKYGGDLGPAQVTSQGSSISEDKFFQAYDTKLAMRRPMQRNALNLGFEYQGFGTFGK